MRGCGSVGVSLEANFGRGSGARVGAARDGVVRSDRAVVPEGPPGSAGIGIGRRA